MREFFGGVVAIAEWAELVSDEHFSVDGSLLRAWASHKSMVARDGSDEPPGPDQGCNPEVDFRGQKRSNATHGSRTDPDSRLASKGGGMAFLSYTTHALAENRHGLTVDVHTTPATGTAETEAALVMIKRSLKPASGSRKPTVAADRGYDTAEFVGALTALGITPHVAAKTQSSAVPEHIKTTGRLQRQSASSKDDRGSLRLGEGYRHAAPFDGTRPGQDSRACAAQFRRL